MSYAKCLYTTGYRQVAKANVACKWLWQVTYATGKHQPKTAGIDKRQVTRGKLLDTRQVKIIYVYFGIVVPLIVNSLLTPDRSFYPFNKTLVNEARA